MNQNTSKIQTYFNFANSMVHTLKAIMLYFLKNAVFSKFTWHLLPARYFKLVNVYIIIMYPKCIPISWPLFQRYLFHILWFFHQILQFHLTPPGKPAFLSHEMSGKEIICVQNNTLHTQIICFLCIFIIYFSYAGLHLARANFLVKNLSTVAIAANLHMCGMPHYGLQM